MYLLRGGGCGTENDNGKVVTEEDRGLKERGPGFGTSAAPASTGL